jgi:hypothetical protein
MVFGVFVAFHIVTFRLYICMCFCFVFGFERLHNCGSSSRATEAVGLWLHLTIAVLVRADRKRLQWKRLTTAVFCWSDDLRVQIWTNPENFVAARSDASNGYVKPRKKRNGNRRRPDGSKPKNPDGAPTGEEQGLRPTEKIPNTIRSQTLTIRRRACYRY